MRSSYYEEKSFNGEVFFRLAPDGAYQKKLMLAPIEHLVNVIQAKLKCRSRLLALESIGMHASTFSRLRAGKLDKISSNHLLNIHDATGLSIKDIRSMCGAEQSEYYREDHHEIERKSCEG